MSNTPTQLHRAFQPDLELARGGDGRTIVGLAVPFDVETYVKDPGTPVYREVFRHGAFAKTIKERSSLVKFLLMHDKNKLPLGVAKDLREDASGLYAELRVSKTREGDEILELVKDGALDGLSAGFRPILPGPAARITPNQLVERREVALNEISLVGQAAYLEAKVLALRGIEELANEAVDNTPRLTAVRKRLLTL